MRILIVDDDFSIRKILSIWLSKLGDCDLAENGVQALEVFKKAYHDKKPYDLVLLDVMMPIMNGIDALKGMRAFENEIKVSPLDAAKVIMATAAANPKSIMGAFNEQCEAYLIKPVEEEELFNAIKKLEIEK